ncbi:hypothetical protein [Comamonas aquatica]|uniref:hypothetical protein n=1 Tax=Comamonas aquatica TaxID=225991 RepID=UPI001B390401|nr:hypothetical protein [Comamonas aquatica]QTX19922.1 hypothetical protein KAQ61_12895 [Comamonas aquatica]
MKKRVLGSIVAGSVLISGCAADLVFLAMHAAEEGFTIKYFPKLERSVSIEPSLNVVTAMPYKRHFMRDESKCQFDGVVVPWERTWEERALGGDAANPQMLPPEPGKIAGYAAVVYQRTCPGKKPEAILHVGVQGTGIFSKPEILAGSSVGMQDVLLTQATNRPQWLPQVVERLVRVAPTSPAAKQVLVTAHEKLAQALPELETALKGAVK